MNRVNLIRCLLLVLIIAAFGRSMLNDFVDWDDGALIYLNPNIKSPELHGMLAQWHPGDPNNHKMYNPLVFSFWWVLARGAMISEKDVAGSSLNPQVYHAANLFFHWMNACLVLEILRRARIRLWPAAAGATIFAIHPIQTEVVVWATAMKDLLSAFFALASILCYLVAMEAEGKARRDRYLLATLLYILSLLSKPSTIVVSFILPVFDVLIFRRPVLPSLKRMVPWAVLGTGALLITKSIQITENLDPLPLIARPLLAADTISFYFYKLILPINLTFDYGRNPKAVLNDPNLFHPLYWTWIFPLLAALIIWRARKRELTLGALIFLFGVLPVLGLINFGFQYFSTPADRYVYLSMLGVAMIVAWVVNRFAGKTTVVLFCAVAVIYCMLSFMQTGVWADSDTLYNYAISLNRVNGVHYMVLAEYQDREAKAALLRSKMAAAEGDPAQVKIEFDRSINYLNKSIENFRTSLRLDPLQSKGYDQLSADLVQAGRFPEAIQVLKDWIAIQPLLSQRQDDPDMLHASLAVLYSGNKQYLDAIKEFELSLSFKENPDVRKKLEAAQKAQAASSRPATTFPEH